MPEVLRDVSAEGLKISTRVEGKTTVPGSLSSPQANGAAKEVLLRLVAQGYNLTQCAQMMERGKLTLRRWAAHPDFIAKLKALNPNIFADWDRELQQSANNLRERINFAADEALDKVIHLMETADSEVVQMRCAQDLLDRRQDTSKIHRIDKREVKVNIDSKWLELAAQAEQEEQGQQVINGV